MNLSPIQYNMLFSIQTIPNIILPIFGGFIIFKIGSSYAILIFVTIQLAGQYICMLSAIDNDFDKMLLGRFIVGLTWDC